MVKVREFIKGLQTYNVGGRSELSSDWECFDWNESEFPPTIRYLKLFKLFIGMKDILILQQRN